MSEPLLTIVIPTYNRAAHLEQRLQELLPQVQQHSNVALYVFDDGSTDDSPKILEQYRARLAKCELSPVNLGLGRNMLRAFESVSTGWLWTLGDDDPVASDAVATALEFIRQAPTAMAINFDSEGGRNTADFSVSGLPDYLSRKDIADVLFMSANLYNMEVLRPFLKIFCQAMGTLAPHLALLLSALERSGRPMVFTTRQLTTFHEWEQRWSSLEAAWGLSCMSIYIKDAATQRLVAQSARRCTRWMLRYGLREVDCAAAFQRWKRYTNAINRQLASYGAGFTGDFHATRMGDSLLGRLAPTILTFLPYSLVKTRARRIRAAHAGQSIKLDNV